jgi:hypothetical protein
LSDPEKGLAADVQDMPLEEYAMLLLLPTIMNLPLPKLMLFTSFEPIIPVILVKELPLFVE